MSTLWQPGMKAQCVSDCAEIRKGEVLTVAGLRIYRKGEPWALGWEYGYMPADALFLQFEGRDGGDYYYSEKFRPVVPRKTSIKIFTDILKEVEAKEPVEGLPW